MLKKVLSISLLSLLCASSLSATKIGLNYVELYADAKFTPDWTTKVRVAGKDESEWAAREVKPTFSKGVPTALINVDLSELRQKTGGSIVLELSRVQTAVYSISGSLLCAIEAADSQETFYLNPFEGYNTSYNTYGAHFSTLFKFPNRLEDGFWDLVPPKTLILPACKKKDVSASKAEKKATASPETYDEDLEMMLFDEDDLDDLMGRNVSVSKFEKKAPILPKYPYDKDLREKLLDEEGNMMTVEDYLYEQQRCRKVAEYLPQYRRFKLVDVMRKVNNGTRFEKW